MSSPIASHANEPAINATVRAYVAARLESGLDVSTVRRAAIAAFTESFADSKARKPYASEYAQQITEAVDAAISAHQRSQPPSCSPSSMSGPPAEPRNA